MNVKFRPRSFYISYKPWSRNKFKYHVFQLSWELYNVLFYLNVCTSFFVHRRGITIPGVTESLSLRLASKPLSQASPPLGTKGGATPACGWGGQFGQLQRRPGTLYILCCRATPSHTHRKGRLRVRIERRSLCLCDRRGASPKGGWGGVNFNNGKKCG